jgi:hypothetical protein
MLNRFSNSNNWRDSLKELKTARDEYAQYSNVMTPYERLTIDKAITEQRHRIEPGVINGAIAEWNNAIEKVERKYQNVQDKKAKETSRWDAAKLTSEMQAVEMMVKQTVNSNIKGPLDKDATDRLKHIYSELQSSKDMYKMRAAGEVYTGLVSMVGSEYDTRREAYHMSKQAQKDAQAARAFPELDQAELEAKEATNELDQVRQTLVTVDNDLGYTKFNGEIGNFAIFQEINRVKVDRMGNIEKILPAEKRS